MNQATHDMYYPTHMPAHSAPPQQASMSSSPYSHQQPPLLNPGPAQYASPYGTQYAYAHGLHSSSGGPPVTHSMQAQNVLPLPSVGASPQGYNNPHAFDTTGQIAPYGIKPRVTATHWEDEESLCFQVEARGVCVARRADNHMINGTKLLNVTKMTRGRRDGILKSEKTRHVVKIGPMHLKGVWIPFDRALDFANKEGITDILYPLFVTDIGDLLYHPTNELRTSQVMAATERRKMEQNHMRNAQSGGHGLPSLQQHHHPMPLPAPPGPSSLSSQTSMGHRSSIDRSHTFPTPPTSASSVMGMGGSEGYQWRQPQAVGGSQGNPSMSIDTSLSNTRSMPTTPATTPPGNNSTQSMQHYPAVSQAYDTSRSMYSAAAPQQSVYAPTTSNAQDCSLYGSQQGYVKNEMGPPTVRPLLNDAADVKSSNGMITGEGASHQAADEDQDAEQHDAEYTHDSGAYDATRTSYNYNPPAVNALSSEHSHLSPEMTVSPHQAGSGRATPRTAAAPQTYYSQQGYHTPPRVQTSSNLYSVMSNDRGSTNGAPTNDVYGTQPDMTDSMQNGYPGVAPLLNGSSGSLKRGRDDDEQRPTSGDGSMGLDLKRRKTMLDGQIPSPTYPSPMVQSVPAMQAVPRRR